MGEIWNMHPGAGEGNRTLVISLEGFCSTIELHPPDSHVHPSSRPHFRRRTSRRRFPPHSVLRGVRRLGGGGWIRTNVGARPTDLQSAPFSRSGTPPAEPAIIFEFSVAWATICIRERSRSRP